MVCLCHYVLWVFQEKKKEKHVAGEWPNGKYFIFSIFFLYVQGRWWFFFGGYSHNGSLGII